MTVNFSINSLAFVIVVVVLAVALSWLAWSRSGFSAKTAWMESLRLAIVALALTTLFQPEYVRTVMPEARSTVVLLRDVSKSMQTLDEECADEVITRSQAIQWLTEEERWNDPSSPTRFVVESFSFQNRSSDLGSDISGALESVAERFPDLRAIVLISDGDWNIGASPSSTAQKFRYRKIPVHTVGVGKPFRIPDLGIANLDVPTFTTTSKPLRIPFTLETTLPEAVDLPVRLQVSSGETLVQTVRVPAKSIASGNFEYTPKNAGDLSLTLSIDTDSRDRIADNNSRTVSVSVRAESLKVLMIESYPRWEYRYTRNALERDPGVEVHCLLYHPETGEMGDGRGYLNAFPSDEQLFEYDVVFLGDVGVDQAGTGELTVDQCLKLRRLVESHSGGLVMMPGMRGAQASLLSSPLSDLFPVELDSEHPRGIGSQQAGHFQLSETGRSSLLTRLEPIETDNETLWRSLPGFYWHAATQRVRPGSQVLATHDSSSSRSGRRPMIVTKTFGNGKVLFMGCDGAWRWRKGVEDKYHYRFWGQVVRWMAYQRNMAEGNSMRLMYSPERPKQDEVVTLQANVVSSNGEPLDKGTVTAQIQSPSGEVQTIHFQRSSSESWGLFDAKITPREGGTYQVALHCMETGAKLETELQIQPSDREKIGRPARPEVLRELASISGGKSSSVAQLDQLIRSLRVVDEPEPMLKRTQLWCHPGWGGLLVGLLSLFWCARKYGGLL